MGDTYAEVAASIKGMAAEAFVGHALTSEGPGEWRFGRPGTVIYSSRVLFRPGTIIVWGDLGEWVLRHGNKDSLGWLRGAVQSPDYLLEKVRAGKRERFYPADAAKLLKDPETEESWGAARVARVREELNGWRGGDFTEEDWAREWYEAGADEVPNVRYPCESALWLIELLRAFVAAEAALAPAGEKEADRG